MVTVINDGNVSNESQSHIINTRHETIKETNETSVINDLQSGHHSANNNRTRRGGSRDGSG